MSKVYHVAAPNGTPFGQMEQAEITAKMASGELPADTLIWTEGMADWQPASTLCPPPVNAASWGMVSAVKTVYIKRFLDFHGRAGRSEYWYAVLGVLVFSLLYAILGGLLVGLLFSGRAEAGAVGAVLLYLPLILFVLYSIIPQIAVMVRRLHDIGLSGWFYLIGFVPYVGGLFLFVCAVIPSTGPNKWGARSDGPAV